MERGNCRGGPGSNSPGQYTCVGGPLDIYVLQAWEAERYELAAPAGISETRFTITAKVPANATKHDFNLMLRSLLEERVGVRAHREAREQAVYEMTAAKGGVKLRPAEAPAASEVADDASRVRFVRDKDGNQMLPPGSPRMVETMLAPGLLRVMARMQSMEKITAFIGRGTGHKVIDKSGLTGNFDYSIDYMSDRAGATSDSSGPTFEEAVREQLGLRLERKKAMVEMLVVDGFRKTVEN